MLTLLSMRNDLKLKLNQDSSQSNLVWEDAEYDSYIKDGVYFVLDHGRLDLIQRSFTVNTSLTLVGTGLYTKPDDYYRFVAAEIDGVWVHELKELNEQKYIEGNDNLKGNSTRKYIYNYDGSTFEVRPTSTSTVALHHIKELLASDFASDTNTSPLTNTGDRYALQYAWGLILQSKLYKADVAEAILNRVEKHIK